MRLSILRVSIAISILLLFASISFGAAKKTSEDVDSKNIATQKQTTKSSTSTKQETKKEAQTTTRDNSRPTLIPEQIVVPTLPAPQAASSSAAAAFNIDWFVIAAGGVSGSSTNYNLGGTVGQTSVGDGNSTNYILLSGFWGGVGGGCCTGGRGDVNGDGINANILDLTFLVDRIFRGGDAPECDGEADLNGDGTPANILDLTFLVDRIFRGGVAPGGCL